MQGFNPKKLPATKMYCTHLANYFELRAIAQSPNSSLKTKQQAYSEMDIADRKMKYWASRPGFNSEFAVAYNMQLKREFAAKS